MLVFSKVERWDQSRLIIHYDPQEVVVPGREGETREEYAHTILVPDTSKGAIVEALLRKEFTLSDEIARLRQRDSKPEDFAAYNEAAEAAKALADRILENI